MKIAYLSYALDKEIPVYGNSGAYFRIRQVKSIKSGDSCNNYAFTMGNHWGTHIDAPAHFFNGAKRITDYPAEHFIFQSPCVISLKKPKNTIIDLSDIKEKVKVHHDILLIKTGFGRLRGLKDYSFNNPQISHEIGLWLRRERPRLRVIGFDFVSIGSLKDRGSGRKAHRAFLNPKGRGNPVLIIEDMNLSYTLKKLSMVLAAPLLVRNVDSAPCTVLGLFKQNKE